MKVKEETVEPVVNEDSRSLEKFRLLLVPSIAGDIDPYKLIRPPESSPKGGSFAIRERAEEMMIYTEMQACTRSLV
jgi:hypothetical protein